MQRLRHDPLARRIVEYGVLVGTIAAVVTVVAIYLRWGMTLGFFD